ncbi:YncE family protein [Candidatus Nitrotoga arctica]|uniref:DUF5648 domain-containing protein n=1 Tax=Candidatus Nitrotoga arctica TaxID=453162 RepID=A0ABM8YX52_9PROT|nr:YncE family protein [Candidatus Nitrotoga arctica]CAG9932113.1 conserved exported protein of unknown function [Candidatus Nitrotoga arctica]
MFNFPKNFTSLQFLVGLALSAASTSALAFCYPLNYKHEHAIAVNPASNKIYAANMVFANNTCRIDSYEFQYADVTVIDGATNQIATDFLYSLTFLTGGGASPDLIAVAVNLATNKIYVADFRVVAVIDGTNNTFEIVPTGVSPHVVAVNPVTNRIYVTNNNNTVTILDGATNSILSTVAVGSDNSTFMHAIVVNPVTNKIYVTNGGDDTVTIINGATIPPRTVSTVATGKHPFAVAVNTVTNRIYVTNNDNSVTIIDGATNSIISTLAVGSDNSSFKQALVVNPVTNKIYVINGGNDTITIIDGATNTTSTLATGVTPRAVALNEKTNKIYVANYGSNSVTVIDGATNTTTTVTVGTHPNSLAVNPETNKVYVTSEDDDAVTVIDSSIVVEFYNTQLDNYFLTANTSEAIAIDGGSAGPCWIRTGNTFKSGGSTAVCRFYGSQSPGPNSHFYTLLGAECDNLKQLQANIPATEKRWNLENLDFLSTLPIDGTCASGLLPVYRAYNNGFTRGIDSNHRISTSPAAIQEVINRGWINEGVVMCAPN